MSLHAIMRRIKRQHNALWVDVKWVEPWGHATWAVFIREFPGARDRKLSRSRSMLVALWRAYWTKDGDA